MKNKINCNEKSKISHIPTIVLAGNPNVGKSTIFNYLTGLRHHTGNWSGKTVDTEEGYFRADREVFRVVDLPGAYSLLSGSPEMELAREYVCFGDYDLLLVVMDATNLKRNLIHAVQLLELRIKNVIVCVNIMDEAEKKGIKVDIDRLKELLGTDVIGVSAEDKQSLLRLKKAIIKASREKRNGTLEVQYSEGIQGAVSVLSEKLRGAYKVDEAVSRFAAQRMLCGDKSFEALLKEHMGSDPHELEGVKQAYSRACELGAKMGITSAIDYHDGIMEGVVKLAQDIYSAAVEGDGRNRERDRRIDKVLTSKRYGFAVMIAILGVVFFITLWGANYISGVITFVFDKALTAIQWVLISLGINESLRDFLINGVLGTLATVVSVMLPPVAIFFPLFTLLEDSGYLPRVAYNLDLPFKKCNSCGKMALTMCMGLGCNAAGVVGCRIISSKKERLIAILTNSFMPCNGKLACIITVVGLFTVTATGIVSGMVSTLVLITIIVFGVYATFGVSYLLSAVMGQREGDEFILELPSYRKPKILKVLVGSALERTLFVLGRAVAVAIPAGALIWIMGNASVGGRTLMLYLCDFLDGFANAIGLDGVILTAFVLGLPANEIVLPLILMGYSLTGGTVMETGAELGDILLSNGWDLHRALCFVVFSVFHMPCSTTLLSIKKETGSILWTVAAALIPTLIGLILCFAINAVFYLIK